MPTRLVFFFICKKPGFFSKPASYAVGAFDDHFLYDAASALRGEAQRQLVVAPLLLHLLLQGRVASLRLLCTTTTGGVQVPVILAVSYSVLDTDPHSDPHGSQPIFLIAYDKFSGKKFYNS